MKKSRFSDSQIISILKQAEGGTPVPIPSKAKRDQLIVELPAFESSKVLLWNKMLSQNVRKAELARRLHVHMPQIDRYYTRR